MTSILVIEDHALVREGLVATLARLEQSVELLQARNAEQALEVLESRDVDLVMLDLMLPGMNGFSFLSVLRKRFATVPVVVVSALEGNDTVTRVRTLGAAGFVPKSCSGEELLERIHTVLDGGLAFADEPLAAAPRRRGRPRKNPSPAERYGLTPAQSRVLELLSQGKSNRDIGELLGLAEGTVKIHLSAIYKALHVSSRTEALVMLARQGQQL